MILMLLLVPVYCIADLIGLYSLLAGNKKWAGFHFITLILMFILMDTSLITYICFAKLFLYIIGFFVTFFPSIKEISKILKK